MRSVAQVEAEPGEGNEKELVSGSVYCLRQLRPKTTRLLGCAFLLVEFASQAGT